MRADVQRAGARDDGMALPSVLLAILILSGLSAVFVAVSMAQSGATGSTRDFENAVHAAEAGAEQVITRINVSPKNAYTTGHQWTSPADEKAWALDIARAASPTDEHRISTSNGWGYGIRPVDAYGKPMDVLYGVGEVTASSGTRNRVVKMQIDVGMYTVAHAILTHGSAKIDKSSVQVTGKSANVHTNSHLQLSNPVIAGKVTACRPGSTSVGCVGSANNSGTYRKPNDGTAYSPEVSQPPVPVPGIDAEEWYEKRFEPKYSGSWFDPANPTGAFGSPPDPTTYDGLWFDMCIRPGETYATVQVPAMEGGTPCSGTWQSAWTAKQVVRLMPRVSCGGGFEYDTQPGESKGGLFKGWHAHSSRWHLCHVPGDGIFYAVGGYPINIDKDHPESAKVKILTDGAITVKGTRSFEPAMEDLLFAAEKPITIEGGPHQLRGVISTQEHLNLKGTAYLEGAVMAQGTAQSTISDNFHINYDGSMRVPFGGTTRITAWNEL
jgi:Tfp pilus assembly protein PilX